MPGYPIVLELSGRIVVVVGLGEVGRRKAVGLIDAGATVRGVDPIGPTPGLPSGVHVIAESYREEHLEGATLVFAAASPDVNRRVVADARRRHLPVNSASDPDAGDFAVPAAWRSGPIVLAVSTSGAGPALAATLRDRAAAAIGPAAAGLASLLAELRPIVLDRITDESTRRALFRVWAEPRWLVRWEERGPEAVRREFWAMLDRLTAAEPPREVP